MKRIVNNTLLSIGVFLLTLLWCNYIKLHAALCITLSLAATIATVFLAERASGVEYDKQQKTKSLQQLRQRYNDYLLFCPSPSKLISQCHAYEGYGCTVLNDTQVISLVDKSNILSSCSFTYKPVSGQDIANLSKAAALSNCTRAICYCICYDSTALTAACSSPIAIELVDLDAILKLLDKCQIQLTLPPPAAKIKKQLNHFLTIALARQRSKYFFWASVFLAVNSLIVPYTLFYLISASLLMTVCIYCRFNTRFNKLKTAVT